MSKTLIFVIKGIIICIIVFIPAQSTLGQWAYYYDPDGGGAQNANNLLVKQWKDGQFILRGLYNSSGTLAECTVPTSLTDPTLIHVATGEGTRLLWYPRKAAFRAGILRPAGLFTYEGNLIPTPDADVFWDEANIGDGSFAVGVNTRASSLGSSALGYWADATGRFSLAGGYNTVASGQASTALGWGGWTEGGMSFACGIRTHAGAYCSAVFGRYNEKSAAPTAYTSSKWFYGDPVFQVGIGWKEGYDPNGTDHPRNAFMVLKNGLIGINMPYPTLPTVPLEIFPPSDRFMGNTLEGEVEEPPYAGSLMLRLHGAVEIKGDAAYPPAPNKVLTCIDPAGRAEWMDPSGGGSIGGAGSEPQVTLWDGTGTQQIKGNDHFLFKSNKLCIGTTVPEFKLTLGGGTSGSADNDGGIMARGSYGNGPDLTTDGNGTMLFWYTKKAAFRAGRVELGGKWMDTKVGPYSMALGKDVQASNYATIALGDSSLARGYSSIAIGNSAETVGDFSFAFGYQVSTSGPYSTAMGNLVSSGSHSGSFIIGDRSSWVANDADNQMMMRFSGGYKLYSNNLTPTPIGVQLVSGGNSWTTISDSTRKENYRPANGEGVLDAIAHFRLGSWNYRGQDAARFRHYGPMAQEFFSAFGHDGVGVIGSDTAIASADIDGVMMIALQGLEKRTRELRSSETELKEALAQLRSANIRYERLLQSVQTLQTRLDRIESRGGESAAVSSIDQR